MKFSRKIDLKLPKVLVLAAVLAVSGCGDDPLGPSGQLQVEKTVDIFLINAMTLEDANETLSYQWDNTGTQATVLVTDGISSGSAILTIEDASGTVLHQDDIADDNDTDTAVGVSGSWRIQIDIQNVTGSFSVSVMKKS